MTLVEMSKATDAELRSRATDLDSDLALLTSSSPSVGSIVAERNNIAFLQGFKACQRQMRKTIDNGPRAKAEVAS